MNKDQIILRFERVDNWLGRSLPNWPFSLIMLFWFCVGIVLAILLSIVIPSAKAQAKEEPYSCKMYYEAQKKCAANTIGPCYIQHEVDRLRAQCAREGGKP